MVEGWASPPHRGQSPPSLKPSLSTASRRPLRMLPKPAILFPHHCLSIKALDELNEMRDNRFSA